MHQFAESVFPLDPEDVLSWLEAGRRPAYAHRFGSGADFFGALIAGDGVAETNHFGRGPLFEAGVCEDRLVYPAESTAGERCSFWSNGAGEVDLVGPRLRRGGGGEGRCRSIGGREE